MNQSESSRGMVYCDGLKQEVIRQQPIVTPKTFSCDKRRLWSRLFAALLMLAIFTPCRADRPCSGEVDASRIPISSAHGFGLSFCRALFGLVLAAFLFSPLASSEVVSSTLSSADVAARQQGKIGGNRAAEIAAIVPLLKAGLTAQEAADKLVLGTPNE